MNKHISILAVLFLVFSCKSGAPDTKMKIPPVESASKVESAPETSDQNSVEAKTISQSNALETEEISPPNPITGAYITAAMLPAEGEGAAHAIKVGIIGMLDDVRLSEKDELYHSTWTIAFSQVLPVVVKLTKSTDKRYDQILEFFGSDEQFQKYTKEIAINLQFRENLNGSIVSSVVVSVLSDLMP